MLVLTRRSGQSIRIGSGVKCASFESRATEWCWGSSLRVMSRVVRSELVEQVSGEVREAADTRASCA